MRFKSAKTTRESVKRQLSQFLMDRAEDFFVWLFRRQHPNPARRKQAHEPRFKKGGFGGGGASL